MPISIQHRLRVAIFLGLASSLAIHPAWSRSTTDIGVAAAVRPAAKGTPPGGAERILSVGADVVVDELVVTGKAGQTHLLFRDGSTLSVGPNSSLVLDRFVYDDDSRTGEIIVSASKGLFRFVGGRISKTRAVQIRTPNAVIGIRGGVALLQVDDGTQPGPARPPATVTMLYGDEVTMTASGTTKRMTRPGSQISQLPGGAITDPQPASQSDLIGMLSALEDAPPPDEGELTAEQLGQLAPAAGGPSVTDEDVSGSQLSELGSGNAPDALDPSPQAAFDLNPAGEIGDEEKQDAAQQLPPNQAAGVPDPPTEDPLTDAPETSVSDDLNLTGLSGRAKHATTSNGTDDSSASSNLAFSDAAIQTTDGVGTLTIAFANDESLVLPFTTDTTPDENAGLQTIGVFSISNAGPQPFGEATLSGEAAVSGNRDFFLYELIDDINGQRVVAWGGAPTPQTAFPTSGVSTYGLSDDFARQSDIPFADHLDEPVGSSDQGRIGIVWDNSTANSQRAVGGGRIGVSQRWSGYVLFGAVEEDGGGNMHIRANTVGSSRTNGSATFSSFFNGPVATSDGGDGSDFFGSLAPTFFNLDSTQVDTNDNTLAHGLTRIENNAASVLYPNSIGFLTESASSKSRSSRTLSGHIAGIQGRADGLNNPGLIIPNASPTSFTLVTNADLNVVGMGSSFGYTVDQEAGNPGPPFGTSLAQSNFDLRFGESTPSGRSAFIHDSSFFATDTDVSGTGTGDGELFLATHDILDSVDFVPTGVSFCACQYVEWGFWGGRLNDGGTPQGIELATWVAGELADSSQTTGVGTPTGAIYSGHVFAHILNDFNDYASGYHAVGNINIGVTFNPGSYSVDSVTITQLDDTNYTSVLNTTAPAFNTNVYNATHLTITGTHPTRGGVQAFIDGASFYGPGTPPEETAGGMRIVSTALQTYKGSATFAARNLAP